jgi:ABC-2 type transport system permease protein
MKIIRVKAIAKKELIQIRRDPFSLAMAFLMPVLLLVIFGYAISFDITNIDTVIVDNDKSSFSREFINRLRSSGYFTVIGYPERYGDIDYYLDSGRAKVAVMIPPDFSRDLRTHRRAQVGAVVDGSDSNTAAIALSYLTSVSERYSQSLANVRIVPLIDVRSRVWYNPDLKSRNFIIPGLIAVIMAVIAALLTSLTVAREWERGTMEQLVSTPVKTPELIIGKMLPYLLIGAIDTVAAVAMSVFLFDVPLKGSVTLLMALSGLFLFGALCWGILISIVARTQLLSSQIALISSFLPAFLLSGFMFSIWNMPRPLQLVTYIIPARYFVSILKGIFLKGSTLAILSVQAFLLALYGAIVFTAATRKFRKRVE